jgi:hypothetical protein
MPLQATMHLGQLRCFEESDGSGHSEPYAWTVLVWADDATIMSPELVGVFAPPVWSSARAVIRRGMKAGERAQMPVSQRAFAHVFEDNSAIKVQAIIVVLWEQDDTPDDAVDAAYEVFIPELRQAVIAFYIAHDQRLPDPDSDEDMKEIVDAVEPAIREAVISKLSGWEKLQAWLGNFNFDDRIDFAAFVMESYAPGDPNRTFRLRFESEDGTNLYEIDGRLDFTQPPDPEACLTELQAVRKARERVDGIQAELDQLAQDVRDADSTAEKEALIAEARRVRREELLPANAALAAAERALTRCFAGQVEQGPVLGRRRLRARQLA